METEAETRKKREDGDMTVEGVRVLRARAKTDPAKFASMARGIREEPWAALFFQEGDDAPAWVGRLGSSLVLLELIERTDPAEVQEARARRERKKHAQELRERHRLQAKAAWAAETLRKKLAREVAASTPTPPKPAKPVRVGPTVREQLAEARVLKREEKDRAKSKADAEEERQIAMARARLKTTPAERQRERVDRLREEGRVAAAKAAPPTVPEMDAWEATWAALLGDTR